MSCSFSSVAPNVNLVTKHFEWNIYVRIWYVCVFIYLIHLFVFNILFMYLLLFYLICLFIYLLTFMFLVNEKAASISAQGLLNWVSCNLTAWTAQHKHGHFYKVLLLHSEFLVVCMSSQNSTVHFIRTVSSTQNATSPWSVEEAVRIISTQYKKKNK